ncbi:MAG: methionyl-tRNA formyltransferase [Ilumatobacter sp.]|nr:methionyl-tRNA formyltransferase [Ilumatobacter sp.]
MKLVYLGTPEIAVPPLRALVGAGHDVTRVITRADKRRGRGSALSSSPVKEAALDLGIPVSSDPDDVVSAAAGGTELGVVVAYGRLLRPHHLDALPMINAHFSLLPRWRGAAPVERALLAGDDVTGVCVMRVEEGLDTGGVYACAEVPITPATTAGDLRAVLVDVASELLVETLARPLGSWIDGAIPQQGDVTYAAKLTKEEFEIDWDQPADAVHRLVRVGGAWTTFRDKRLKIVAADVVDGRLVPTRVQPEGKGEMSFDAWRNGARPAATELFGDR